ncbi:uncharacterized protein Z518_10598 [Rhinocladiella mackenziei CBS 650.93]|uniref:Uncharacterized protein n=1 Tax=Rhinocladiella mackenziei CBS 650.93 TaxID=1442369 RepID=A0A0D2GQ73_9EURO|nr:uncharacterized protein Z518_10598 [Rhinocladiella mackenziei CBS 650.93]KIX00458.1 hypothetical protein Z518_10598 [Rhinocladiella mackenziei CBS 650.93]
MPVFGFSVGGVIAAAGFSSMGSSPAPGRAAQNRRTMIELESLGRVLRKIEGIIAHDEENTSYTDSLRAAAFATALTLKDFLKKL